MPKSRLEFNLPEEQSEFNAAIHGMDWKLIVYDLSLFLRNKLKYGHEFKTADDALEAVKTELWEQCKSSNLDPWSD